MISRSPSIIAADEDDLDDNEFFDAMETAGDGPAQVCGMPRLDGHHNQSPYPRAVWFARFLPRRSGYRSLAGFHTTVFRVVSAPLSTLVHLDNPTCDKCSQR
jgi:hypothetical protein